MSDVPNKKAGSMKYEAEGGTQRAGGGGGEGEEERRLEVEESFVQCRGQKFFLSAGGGWGVCVWGGG